MKMVYMDMVYIKMMDTKMADSRINNTSQIDITMPSLGADMSEGTLIEWLVDVGDHVNKGDIVAVLETDKGAIDMETYQAGKVAEILVQPVAKVPVGTVLARLESASDSLPSEACEQKENKTALKEKKETLEQVADNDIVEKKRAEEKPLEPATKFIPPPQSDLHSTLTLTSISEVRASPLVRKMAVDLQLDLSAIKGSGPAGAILLNDISGIMDANKKNKKPAAKTQAKAHESNDNIFNSPVLNTKVLNTNPMRVAIASAMEKSKREIPHYYLSRDIDISAAQQWLRTENTEREPDQRQLLLALLLKAVAMTLIKYPSLNGYYIDNQFQASDSIHIGNVISLREGGLDGGLGGGLGGGLIVPAIHNVEKLSVDDIMQALRDIVHRSRRGRLRSSELTDATITVSNMGDRGADTVLGVIYPPQVAIIGFGRPRKAPQVQENAVVVSDIISISLSADHRVSDGGLGAKFLQALSKKLQKPELL
jgi:pyruvate dehydrogenase E2 component (dihydrolipoamide acetyltransferase)